MYGPAAVAHRSTLDAARALLDRYFRDAEGRSDQRLDVGFIAADLDLRADRLHAGTDYLVARGLVRMETPDAAYLTELGVVAARSEEALESLPLVRSFQPTVPPPGRAGPRSGSAPIAELGLVPPEGGKTVRIELGARCSLGRAADNTVVVDDKRASKHHAQIYLDGGHYVLEDLQSANGTLLNSDYCTHPTPLSNEDEIVIGRTMVVYYGPSAVPSSRPPHGRSHSGPSTSPRPAASGPSSGAQPVSQSRGMPILKGRPAAAAPSDLFSRPREPSPFADVFDARDFDRHEEPHAAPRPSVDRDAPTVASEEGTAPPEPTILPPEEAPPADDVLPAPAPRKLEAADARTLVPHAPSLSLPPFPAGSGLSFDPADGHTGEVTVDAPMDPTPEPVLELSEIVRPETPSIEDPTLSLGLDLVGIGAEELPEAAANLAEFEHPAEVTAPPPFLRALERLEHEVLRVTGEGPHPLLQAVRTVREHPLVRAFAEEDME